MVFNNINERMEALAKYRNVSLDKVEHITGPYIDINKPSINGKGNQADGRYIVAMRFELEELVNNAMEEEFSNDFSNQPELFDKYKGDDDDDTYCNWEEERRKDGNVSILAPNYPGEEVIILVKDSEDGINDPYYIFQQE